MSTILRHARSDFCTRPQKCMESGSLQLQYPCRSHHGYRIRAQKPTVNVGNCGKLNTINTAWGLFSSSLKHHKSSRLQAFHKTPRESKGQRHAKKVQACVTDKPAEQQEEAQESPVAPEPLDVIVKEGRRPDELRAAAVLRSNSFNVYPPGRSEAAAKVRS
jgi:hypothetical protein